MRADMTQWALSSRKPVAYTLLSILPVRMDINLDLNVARYMPLLPHATVLTYQLKATIGRSRVVRGA